MYDLQDHKRKKNLHNSRISIEQKKIKKAENNTNGNFRELAFLSNSKNAKLFL